MHILRLCKTKNPTENYTIILDSNILLSGFEKGYCHKAVTNIIYFFNLICLTYQVAKLIYASYQNICSVPSRFFMLCCSSTIHQRLIFCIFIFVCVANMVTSFFTSTISNAIIIFSFVSGFDHMTTV